MYECVRRLATLKNGDFCTLSVFVAVVGDDCAGTNSGVRRTQLRGLMVDITESKQTEATLQQLVRELEASPAELQERNAELETFHDITVGRELKMIALEKEMEQLQRERGAGGEDTLR